MDERYYELKNKLEALGYTHTLPIEAVPLVECLTADLLQTTRSLQSYMDMAKEAIQQRDTIRLESEPYKCDNAKLIKENNYLHQQLLKNKEENQKLHLELRRKIQQYEQQIEKADENVIKFRTRCRDLELRGICADTLASRGKIHPKVSARQIGKNQGDTCYCRSPTGVQFQSKLEARLNQATENLELAQEKYQILSDEILTLQTQVKNRDEEILRLSTLLKGGRPYSAVSQDCCNKDMDKKILKTTVELQELEMVNAKLNKLLAESIDKQHEAMTRAVALSEKSSKLEEELRKVDALALKVEEECNKRLAEKTQELYKLQSQMENLIKSNIELERRLADKTLKTDPPRSASSDRELKFEHNLNNARAEIEKLQRENENLLALKQKFEENIKELQAKYQEKERCVCERRGSRTDIYQNTNVTSKWETQGVQKATSEQEFKSTTNVNIGSSPSLPALPPYATKEDLQQLLDNERRHYEKHMMSLQRKLTEALEKFNSQMTHSSSNGKSSSTNAFIKDLHKKICDCERQLLDLKDENDTLRRKISTHNISSEHNTNKYFELEEKIRQLNKENSEISKENIQLTNLLSCAKQGQIDRHSIDREKERLNAKINQLNEELTNAKYDSTSRRRERDEYQSRYMQAFQEIEHLKSELVAKNAQYDQLYEENTTYRMNNRTGRASVDHLRDECEHLRDQIKKLQLELIQEKTLNSQMKNLQIETERSSCEVQNQITGVQKQLSLTRDKYSTVERRNKELLSEIASLRGERNSLLDTIKKIDQERDMLVVQVDNKTEAMSMLECQIQNKNYEIEKLEADIIELKRRAATKEAVEHRLRDTEARAEMLISDIQSLTNQRDNAIIENQRLQNSLANVSSELKITKMEYDKSLNEIETMKSQLQHYVAEVKRIEDLLSRKETERSEMLEHFASLSVEANILENNNHSLENETASKSMQLQTALDKVQDFESKIFEKDSIIESQSATIASMKYKISALEKETNLLREERSILEKNISYLKEICQGLESEKHGLMKGMGDNDTELHLYEERMRKLSDSKAKFELESTQSKLAIESLETLLSQARREVVELKLALQEATSETKQLKKQISESNFRLQSLEGQAREYRERAEDATLQLQDLHQKSNDELFERMRARELSAIGEMTSRAYSSGTL